MADKITIRNDFEYARVWLERLYSCQTEIKDYRRRQFLGDVYSILANSDESDAKLVRDLFTKYKDRLRWLESELSDYNDPMKYATIEEYFDYLKKTIEENYIKPLRNALAALGERPYWESTGEPHTLEEANELLEWEPTTYSVTKQNIISDTGDFLSLLNEILQLVDSFKRSPLYNKNLGTGQETTNIQIGDNSYIEIPPDHRTLPMSQTELADILGSNMTQEKVSSMIKTGALKAIKLSRQSFIFDKRTLPKGIIDKLDNLK